MSDDLLRVEAMSKDERSLLLYLETRAVDHYGKVDMRKLNAAEARAAAWQRAFTDLTELPLRCEECALDGCNTDCECPCHAERAASIEQIKRHALAGEKGDGDEQG